MNILPQLFRLTPLMLLSLAATATNSVEIQPHPHEQKIRALNGGTLSPVANMKLLDMRELHQSLSIPIVRLHDAPWLNDFVVDVHAIFPNFHADINDPKNYDFRKTDDFLKTILETETGVVFRLGESIEHTETKYYVNPPSDHLKWAKICANIIRHYNEGWADGYELGIKYWEIWNEPDIDSMWTGSQDDFFQFFSTAAKHLKNEFPKDILIGGPALAHPLDDNKRVSSFFDAFLKHLKKNDVPLDFFSWHNYDSSPVNLLAKVEPVRTSLDKYGFSETQMHLNEWNYIPENHWGAIYKPEFQGNVRKSFYEKQSGSEGAAFVSSVLIGLQDLPVDIANYYTSTVGLFGIYSYYGEPHKTYYAFKAFAELLNAEQRLLVSHPTLPISILAAQDTESNEILVLISNFQQPTVNLEIELSDLGLGSNPSVQRYLIDANHDLELVDSNDMEHSEAFTVSIQKDSVVLLKIR